MSRASSRDPDARSMDFLLECIGFPPDFDPAELADLLERFGEPTPWRDPAGRHRRLALGEGLELRLEAADSVHGPEIWPFFTGAERLRIEVDRLERPADSPFDALLHGWVDPPAGDAPAGAVGRSWPFTTWLADRRRLPASVRRGRVLAVSVAGYALDVTAVDDRARAPFVEPLGGPEDPGGCVELELGVLAVSTSPNPITGAEVHRVLLDGPGRPLTVFLSPWLLDEDGLPLPRVGGSLRGTFLFNGRVTGGLPSATRRLGRSFG